ncbi:hypothetical protein PMI42_04817 [Bradyrhizobium sp. YR681]|uniref:hypothetical protein n=1 Tax=Bradyrhizobium sp. YR681 TaxID=1144344 RepID=UPI0002710D17|nr:hypothetical protein [Bradyrhizobium sp. YR681]EJN11803.1 hypothetical protein PMI42_04817 [Bradyrhizobium sp. YR681]
MSEADGDIKFEPANMGQALGVLVDVVGCYISAAHTAAFADDRKKSAQVNLTLFLHGLCMRSKYKAETADILDMVSAELRRSTQEEAGADAMTADLLKPNGNDGVVNAEICFGSLLLVGDVDVSPEMVATWAQDQMDLAYDWAMRVHLHASDNNDVFVPERPDFIPRSVRPSSTDS